MFVKAECGGSSRARGFATVVHQVKAAADGMSCRKDAATRNLWVFNLVFYRILKFRRFSRNTQRADTILEAR
jgi:hypothetical protein